MACEHQHPVNVQTVCRAVSWGSIYARRRAAVEVLSLEANSGAAVLAKRGDKYVVLTALHVIVADDAFDYERRPDPLP